MNHDYVLVAGRSNPELAKKIADCLHKPLLSVDILQFKDGEIQVYYNESIRGRDVFIIQPTFSPA
ncbi:ribose-phosphate pyrophosphokinase-like domain-containing protein, partial [Klebsiella pneumoniae]|uniref:ribose-phosphate pyrophosphokinase-like domain-containing protein n=1 Tax=Klebsiella pneumoniae TaxID=573 RepID=UPI0034D97495